MTIEQTIISVLSELLPVPVAAEIPPGPPDSYIIVEKTGQREENLLYTGSVVLLSNAPTMAEAIRIDAAARRAMRELTRVPGVFRVNLENSYNNTTRAIKNRQYLSEYEIIYKED